MTEERQERTDIDKVIRSLTSAISEHGGGEGFYDRLAEQIPQAAKQARELAQTESRFSDPDAVNQLRQEYLADLRKRGAAQPSVIAMIKNEYRQKYGRFAETLWSEPSRW